jgi:hypothetical protein
MRSRATASDARVARTAMDECAALDSASVSTVFVIPALFMEVVKLIT